MLISVQHELVVQVWGSGNFLQAMEFLCGRRPAALWHTRPQSGHLVNQCGAGRLRTLGNKPEDCTLPSCCQIGHRHGLFPRLPFLAQVSLGTAVGTNDSQTIQASTPAQIKAWQFSDCGGQATPPTATKQRPKIATPKMQN